MIYCSGFLPSLSLTIILTNLPGSRYNHFLVSGSRIKKVSPYLQVLRSQFKLDDIIAGYHTDYEQALAMMNWVHHLWRHNGDNEPVKSDPISILTEVIEHQ